MCMRKEYIIAIIAAITIVIGIIIGLFLGDRNETTNLQPESGTILANQKEKEENEIQSIPTVIIDVKTSPNTLYVFQTYYQNCKHVTAKTTEIPEEDVNKTEEKLQEKYKDWGIQKFTPTEVIFYQEKEGICEEHYLVKDDNGYISIYTLDILGQATLKEKTEIVTNYLPETDKTRLKEGIQVIGQEKLNATLEDYE